MQWWQIIGYSVTIATSVFVTYFSCAIHLLYSLTRYWNISQENLQKARDDRKRQSCQRKQTKVSWRSQYTLSFSWAFRFLVRRNVSKAGSEYAKTRPTGLRGRWYKRMQGSSTKSLGYLQIRAIKMICTTGRWSIVQEWAKANYSKYRSWWWCSCPCGAKPLLIIASPPALQKCWGRPGTEPSKTAA